MSDVLHLTLARAELARPGFSAAEVHAWPAGALDRACAVGLLQPGAPSRSAACPGCGRIAAVVYLAGKAAGEVRAYVPCPECGPARIEPDSLRRWTIGMPALLDAVFADIELRGSREELATDCLWRLGKTTWLESHWEVFFARCLQRPGGMDALEQTRFSVKALVFVPKEVPPQASDGLLLIPLTSVVNWQPDGIHFDREYVETQLADRLARQQGAIKRQLPKRATRAADIAALTKELMAHLRAARDHAVATEDRHGTPRLLPRPTQEDLARRIGTSQWAVSRCLADESARELKFLWDLAVDVERILAFRR